MPVSCLASSLTGARALTEDQLAGLAPEHTRFVGQYALDSVRIFLHGERPDPGDVRDKELRLFLQSEDSQPLRAKQTVSEYPFLHRETAMINLSDIAAAIGELKATLGKATAARDKVLSPRGDSAGGDQRFFERPIDSLARAAKKSVLFYPVVASESLSPETVSMLAKLVQVRAGEYLRLMISNMDVLDADSVGKGAVVAALRGDSLKTTAYGESAEALAAYVVKNVAALAEANGHRVAHLHAPMERFLLEVSAARLAAMQKMSSLRRGEGDEPKRLAMTAEEIDNEVLNTPDADVRVNALIGSSSKAADTLAANADRLRQMAEEILHDPSQSNAVSHATSLRKSADAYAAKAAEMRRADEEAEAARASAQQAADDREARLMAHRVNVERWQEARAAAEMAATEAERLAAENVKLRGRSDADRARADAAAATAREARAFADESAREAARASAQAARQGARADAANERASAARADARASGREAEAANKKLDALGKAAKEAQAQEIAAREAKIEEAIRAANGNDHQHAIKLVNELMQQNGGAGLDRLKRNKATAGIMEMLAKLPERLSADVVEVQNGNAVRANWDEKDYQKVAAILPLTMQLTVDYRVGGETGRTIRTPLALGVKAVGHVVPSLDIVTGLGTALQRDSLVLQFLRLTSGETSFVKDFVLNLDTAKMRASGKTSGGTKMLETLRRQAEWNARRGNAFVAMLSKRGFVPPTTTIIVTADEVEKMKSLYGVDFAKPGVARELLRSHNLMGFMIVDEAIGLVRVFEDGDDDFDRVPFSEVKAKGKENSVKDILTIMGRT